MNETLYIVRHTQNAMIVTLSGSWTIDRSPPDRSAVAREIDTLPEGGALSFRTGDIAEWDSGLLVFLVNIKNRCAQKGVRFEDDGLPLGVRRLLDLSASVPERKGARREAARISFLQRVGEETIAFGRSAHQMLEFIGDVVVAMVSLLRGRSGFRTRDFFSIVQECGAQALPIVSLISMLVGLILAFVGAIQLMMFGAQIYVASLVGVAMVRVMGAVMAGVIMAGRTGAAFAAQLGTMEVNEEIDALKTLGISPIQFLVLPRMLALALMMPLLCLYADLMGIIGGLIVGVTMLDLNLVEYFLQTRASVGLNDFWVGLFQAGIFGILVAVAGCLRGMQCGRSASAVGEAATSAVVTGIVSIVVATALVTVMCNVLKI